MKNNKLFVKVMIITAIVGLTTLMIAMFIGIKFFTEKSEVLIAERIELPVESPEVEITSTILGIVRRIDEKNLNLFDIEKKQMITTNIEQTTQIEDAYGNTIPLEQIQKGEIVELIYHPQKDHLVSLSKTNRAWKKSNMTGIKIDISNQQIIIADKVYTYDKDTFILDEQGQEINIKTIGKMDKVDLSGVEDKVWSIKVLEKGGQITIGSLPTYSGTLELDINQSYPLDTLKEPIFVEPGNHKIVLRMDGYEPIVQEIEIVSGGKVEVTAEGAKVAYTEVSVKVAGGLTDYTVEVNGKKYAPGEVISLEKGTYVFKVKAKGYKEWAMQVAIEGESKELQAVLTPEESAPTQEPTNTSNNQTGQTASYQINIATDPEGAEVYVGGVYKGTTPYRVTLPLGDYLVELKKEGYETYTTSLIIDNSDNQNSYLYMLTPLQ